MGIDNINNLQLTLTMTLDDTAITRLSAALAAIETAAAENVERSLEIQRRVQWLHTEIDKRHRVADLIEAESEPRMVELISTNIATLETVGSELRASLALALRDEGLTIEHIAALFGVTRQRISALLRQKAASTDSRA